MGVRIAWWAASFRPGQGTKHILFLAADGPFLRTVGDYPAYDLPISTQDAEYLISAWRPQPAHDSDLFNRLAETLITAELRALSSMKANYSPREIYELAGLTSAFHIAGLLDSFCRTYPSPFGRFAACAATAREFPGRCAAYRLAMDLASSDDESTGIPRWLTLCTARLPSEINHARASNWPLPVFDYGWRATAERLRANLTSTHQQWTFK